MMLIRVKASGCVESIVDEVARQMIKDGRAEVWPPKEVKKVEAAVAPVQTPDSSPKAETATASPKQETATVPSYVRSAKSALNKIIRG